MALLKRSTRGKNSFAGALTSMFNTAGRGLSEPDGLASGPVARDYRHSLETMRAARDAGTAVVELSFACSDLPKMDIMSDSDPFLVVWLADGVKQEVELLRTETVWDEQFPIFVRSLIVAPGPQKMLRVIAYDRDGPTEKLEKQDFMGETKFALEDVLACTEPAGLQLPLKNRRGDNKGGATLTVLACKNVPLDDYAYSLEFQMATVNRLRCNSDIFFMIFRQVTPLAWAAIFRSEVLAGKAEASAFKLAQMSVLAGSMGNAQTKLRFEVFKYRASGSHESCGSFVTSLAELEYLSTAKGVAREFIGSEDELLERAELTGGFLSDEKLSFIFDLHFRK